MFFKYLRKNDDFYDLESIKQFSFMFSNGEIVLVYPETININLGFCEEPHKNLRGQTVGLIRNFKGGTMSIEVPVNNYFKKEFVGKFEDLVDIYIYTEEQRVNKAYQDKFVCSFQGYELKTQDPRLTYKMDFNIFSVFRKDVIANTDFVSLCSLNSSYYVQLLEDKTKLTLIYSLTPPSGNIISSESLMNTELNSLFRKFKKNGNEVQSDSSYDIAITLDHVTEFKTNTKLRNNQQRMDKEGTWLMLQDGVEPMILSVTARLYDKIELIGSTDDKMNLKPNTSPKEDILKDLLRLLNEEIYEGVSGRFPPQVYLKSTLISEILLKYVFFLVKVDHIAKDNYIEVSLEFIERREEKPVYPPYAPKNKALENKRGDLFTIETLSAGKIKKELEEEVKNRIKLA